MYPGCLSMCIPAHADRKKALEAFDIGSLVRETEMSLQTDNSPNTRQKTKIFFVLMFMLRGIPFVDLAYLHKRDLQGNTLSYRRRKTGRALTVSLTPEAMQMVRIIANKDKDSPYLFPILQSEEGTEAAYREYQSALRAFNQRWQCSGSVWECSRHSVVMPRDILGPPCLPLRDTSRNHIRSHGALLHHSDGNLSEAFQQQKD